MKHQEVVIVKLNLLPCRGACFERVFEMTEPGLQVKCNPLDWVYFTLTLFEHIMAQPIAIFSWDNGKL